MLNTAKEKDPLAPHVLYKAGVALEDAIWFGRQPATNKTRVLISTTRGKHIIERVRLFGLQTSSSNLVRAH